jgi:hypothetical protein
LSRVDAALTLDEIKDFFTLAQGNPRRSKGKLEPIQFNDSVQIAEVL